MHRLARFLLLATGLFATGLFATWATAGVVRADDSSGAESELEARARDHFYLGQRAYERGAYAEAASHFEQTLRLFPHPDLYFNLYLAYTRADDRLRAARSLRAFLERRPDAPNSEDLRRTLAELEATFDEEADAPAVVPSPRPPPEDARWIGPLILGASGAALAVAAIPFGVLAQERANRLGPQCDASAACAPGTTSMIDELRALATVTDVLWIAGAAVMAGALVWWLIDATRGVSSDRARSDSALLRF